MKMGRDQSESTNITHALFFGPGSYVIAERFEVERHTWCWS